MTSNRVDRAKRHVVPIKHLVFLLLAVPALAASAPATATPAAGAPPTGSEANFHACGGLVDAARPWHSNVDGGTPATGDHWITSAEGSRFSCSFTHAAIHRLLALPPRTYAGRDVGHILGGLCEWSLGEHHEHYQPFHPILCHLPFVEHNHRYTTTVRAFIDPDPRFIHPA